ncbi:helix-turn-helix domain-containing protein [Teredinibacter turnerae]|uniref:helix-turn-helix domain-containing protein n=1 Tax=Teredinibacter turnerae TaxID=2426 RepID=UPI0003695479|nr:helix-turn-helix transcriptional regulator [Teredinibacter turnerae]
MMLKRLRHKRNWTQEQLAEISGLSVRTIQRIESGGKASLESLNALASVLEVQAPILAQGVTVIDKTTEDWEKVPAWLRACFFGSALFKIPERILNIRVEQGTVVAGIILLLLSPVLDNAFDASFILFTSAYLVSLITRAGDKYSIW